jgi:hypothetical protein
MIVLLVIALMAVAAPMALMVFLLFTVSGRRVMMRRQLDGLDERFVNSQYAAELRIIRDKVEQACSHTALDFAQHSLSEWFGCAAEDYYRYRKGDLARAVRRRER